MFTFASQDGVRIHVHEWKPAGAPRGIVQIAHGAGEHALRYGALATELTDRGFVVYAQDHRGHGLSMHAGPGVLGQDGWNLLVEDEVALTRLARERHPGLPLVFVGHSLGSFAAQHYVLDHSDLVDGLALSGTTAVDRLFELLAQAEGGAGLAGFNAPFAPGRTGFEWLSRDEAEVDAYVADPLCGFDIEPGAMAGLVAVSQRMVDPSTVRADLPVYVVVGDEDPLNNKLAFTDEVVDRYRKAGLVDVEYRTYPGARHEVLNETNRAEVTAELVAWIERVVG